jgi:hypothetical protein
MHGLSGLEQAIRNALERAERADPDIRARIYQSARNALDAGLRKQEIADASVVERQRQRLESTIRGIEDEEMARLRSIAHFQRVALDRDPEPEPEPEPEPTVSPVADSRYEPEPEPAPIETPARHVQADPETWPVAVPKADIQPAAAPVISSEPVAVAAPVQVTRPATAKASEPRLEEPRAPEFGSPEPITPDPERRKETPSGSRFEPTFASASNDEPLDAEFEDDRPASFEARKVPPVFSSENSTQARERAAQADDDEFLGGLSASRGGRASDLAPERQAYSEADAEALAPTRKRRSRLGGFLASAFVYLFLLGIVGGGVWWVYDTGMIDAALEGSSDFQLVPDALRSETAQPATDGSRLDTLRGFSGDWIDIYTPGTAAADAAVTPRSRATIEQSRDSDGVATVITSNAPDQDGDVLVEVPSALLADLAGKTAIIAVTVKSNTDKPAQIYIQCEFKSLGDCGRHRYTVTNERADELIQLEFDGKMSPSAPGHLVINSDLTGEGSSIKLYGIRVRPAS